MVSPEMPKNLISDFLFLSYWQKLKKKWKKLTFLADFFISKIVNISGLVIDRGNPNAPLERFIQARRFELKFSSLSGHQAAQMPK